MPRQLITLMTCGLVGVAGLAIADTGSTDAVEPGLPPVDKAVETSNPSLGGFDPLEPFFSATGSFALSVDALGTPSGGNVQVEKPSADATVFRAYLATASQGFSNNQIANGTLTLGGVGVNWDQVTPNSINCFNHLANVTDIVAPIVDPAGPGLIDIFIQEPGSVDGSILAVVFNDPNAGTDNTVILAFGAQATTGDSFAITTEPIDLADLVLDAGLGISFGAQDCSTGQFSIVDVNGQRLTSCAGGEDDGACANGELITVGGIGDSNDNPDPDCNADGDTRTDDELYNLVPFVNQGDTVINFDTLNPSNDDNIFFAHFFTSVPAVVEGNITLAPLFSANPIGDSHTVTATVTDDDGNPISGRTVDFEITSGPNAGLMGSDVTDAGGEASFTYVGDICGSDTIVATDDLGEFPDSNTVTKVWLLCGDIDRDCDADVEDLMLLLGLYDTMEGDNDFNPDADLNGDGTVDVLDLLEFLGVCFGG